MTNVITTNPMSTNNTKPEGKELNAFRFMQKKIGENLWRFPQGYSQSTIFGFMEEFAQLSPSDHTAPQVEEAMIQFKRDIFSKMSYGNSFDTAFELVYRTGNYQITKHK